MCGVGWGGIQVTLDDTSESKEVTSESNATPAGEHLHSSVCMALPTSCSIIPVFTGLSHPSDELAIDEVFTGYRISPLFFLIGIYLYTALLIS